MADVLRGFGVMALAGGIPIALGAAKFEASSPAGATASRLCLQSRRTSSGVRRVTLPFLMCLLRELCFLSLPVLRHRAWTSGLKPPDYGPRFPSLLQSWPDLAIRVP